MTRRIPLTGGQFATVDDADYESLSQFKWSFKRISPTLAYAVRTSRGSKRTTIYMHREIVGSPRRVDIDHIDGDGLNNTRENLRIATHSQNMANQRLCRDSSSGYKGVHKNGKAWIARISGEYLGSFTDTAEAARAYDAAAQEKFGKFARLNFHNKKPGTL